MESYGRIRMLTHDSHGTGTPVTFRESPDGQTKAEQKLFPRNLPLIKESPEKQQHAKGKCKPGQ
jgi:hypothetical protein